MSMTEQTVKCPICGRPYKVYSHYAGDQSACSSCRAEASKNASVPESWRRFPVWPDQHIRGQTINRDSDHDTGAGG